MIIISDLKTIILIEKYSIFNIIHYGNFSNNYLFRIEGFTVNYFVVKHQ